MLLDEAISATKFLSSLLGFDGPKTYPLLGQNQKEIRASGGFIGIAVEATVDQGELLELVFHDSTTVDREPLTSNPTPPEGLFWYLWMGRLLFRDSNWNPHFPSAAAQVTEIFRLGQGTQVDGTITGSKELMLDMVAVFGDITVPGAEGVLTRKTAEAYTDGVILYHCLEGRVSLRGKRCFDEDAFFALKERLTTQTLTSALRRELVELIDQHLERKNVMMHVFPPTDDSFLWERGWNGAIPVVDHDYLMVVDSSLPGHSTAGVQRSFEYRVSLQPNEPVEAHLRLRYDNSDEPRDEICRQFTWVSLPLLLELRPSVCASSSHRYTDAGDTPSPGGAEADMGIPRCRLRNRGAQRRHGPVAADRAGGLHSGGAGERNHYPHTVPAASADPSPDRQ